MSKDVRVRVPSSALCLHDWKSVDNYLKTPLGSSYWDLYICNKCGREGQGVYDMISGSIYKTKARPRTDLRIQNKIHLNPYI